MAEHFQVVHPLVGQVYVAPRMVVVDVGKAHLQTVGVSKEPALRIRIRDTQVGVETIARIAQHHAAVTLAASSVAQPLVL